MAPAIARTLGRETTTNEEYCKFAGDAAAACELPLTDCAVVMAPIGRTRADVHPLDVVAVALESRETGRQFYVSLSLPARASRKGAGCAFIKELRRRGYRRDTSSANLVSLSRKTRNPKHTALEAQGAIALLQKFAPLATDPSPSARRRASAVRRSFPKGA